MITLLLVYRRFKDSKRSLLKNLEFWDGSPELFGGLELKSKNNVVLESAVQATELAR